MNYRTATAVHIIHHGGNYWTEVFELELGFRAAFDLFHHDDIMINGIF